MDGWGCSEKTLLHGSEADQVVTGDDDNQLGTSLDAQNSRPQCFPLAAVRSHFVVAPEKDRAD